MGLTSICFFFLPASQAIKKLILQKGFLSSQSNNGCRILISTNVCLCICPSVHPSAHPSVHQSIICSTISPSNCLSLCSSVHPSAHPSLHQSIHLSMYLPIHQFISLSIHQSIPVFISLSICPAICPSLCSSVISWGHHYLGISIVIVQLTVLFRTEYKSVVNVMLNFLILPLLLKSLFFIQCLCLNKLFKLYRCYLFLLFSLH